MTRGQESLNMDVEIAFASSDAGELIDAKKLTVLRASAAELKAHEKILDAIDKTANEQGGSLWRHLDTA